MMGDMGMYETHMFIEMTIVPNLQVLALQALPTRVWDLLDTHTQQCIYPNRLSRAIAYLQRTMICRARRRLASFLQLLEDQAVCHWMLAAKGTEVHANSEAWKLLSHGDHIVVMVGGWRHRFAHHGIVLRESGLDQDPDIAHFTSPSGDKRMRDARLQIDTYIKFLARHTTYGIVPYTSPTDLADELVQRKRAANIAKLMVETPSMALRKYDLIHWNCECFAWICKTGGLKHNSDQVYRVLRTIGDDLQKGEKSFLLQTASVTYRSSGCTIS
jgi:hypothetical protein